MTFREFRFVFASLAVMSAILCGCKTSCAIVGMQVPVVAIALLVFAAALSMAGLRIAEAGERREEPDEGKDGEDG